MAVKQRGYVILWGSLLALPLLAGAAWLYANDRWAPVFDIALMEMRVRDVGGRHSPLLGLPGRLGLTDLGSHPGPLAFYLLAPVYRMLGATYGALRVSLATLGSVAMIASVLMAHRRVGATGVAVVGLATACIEVGFGLIALTEPWNPHVPIPWFMPFLVAVWSVLDGDVAMLPVAALAGSLAAQTHIPYLAVCGLLGCLAFAVAATQWARSDEAAARAAARRACLVAIGAVAVAWAPPAIEQLASQRGNVSILVDYFSHTTEPSVGLAQAEWIVLERFDAWHLVVEALGQPGLLRDPWANPAPSPARGLGFFMLWAVAAASSRRVGPRSLVRLHLTVLAAFIVASVATARIAGQPWMYITFFGWSIGALAATATAWTGAVVVARWLPERWSEAGATLARAAAVGAAAVSTLRMASFAPESGSSTPTSSWQLAVLAEATGRALEDRAGPATGRSGRYFVTWTDGLWSGGQGIGLVNELERRGFTVGVHQAYTPMIPTHRVMQPRDATAGVWYATGGWIHDPSRPRGAIPLAYFDPRTPDELAEYDRVRRALETALVQAGKPDMVHEIDKDVHAVERAEGTILSAILVKRLDVTGFAGAVFVTPRPGR